MSGNEMLFYGGITVFICSGIAAVISFGTLKLKAIRLHAKFDEEYGSCKCSEIQQKIYGKSYRMYIPEEKAEFIACGGHGPNGCTKVVGNAAVWVGEILEEEGLLDK